MTRIKGIVLQLLLQVFVLGNLLFIFNQRNSQIIYKNWENISFVQKSNFNYLEQSEKFKELKARAKEFKLAKYRVEEYYKIKSTTNRLFKQLSKQKTRIELVKTLKEFKHYDFSDAIVVGLFEFRKNEVIKSLKSNSHISTTIMVNDIQYTYLKFLNWYVDLASFK